MFEDNDVAAARPLWLVREADLDAWIAGQDAATRAWLGDVRFRAERHQVACISSAQGGARAAVLGLGGLATLDDLEPWHVAGAPDRLPAGAWKIATALPARAATAAALGWAHGSYRFNRYRTSTGPERAAPSLVPPQLADMAYVRRMSAALSMARDMINTPAADLTPESLAVMAMHMASGCGAEGRVVSGDALREGFPAIHAVGRAAECAPRLIDFSWGDPGAPRVTLVGKGVCFDSGGLDIKAPQGMLLMKKDMGGAACVLALARVIMESALPVRLRVLVPAVENSIAGNAYRPGDVLRTRKGLTVEVGNTDAEGRLVLSRGRSAAAGGHGHADRRCPGRARSRTAGTFRVAHRDGRGAAAPRARARGPAVADAALGWLRRRDREQGGRHEQRVGLDVRRSGDRRTLPQALREPGA